MTPSTNSSFSSVKPLAFPSVSSRPPQIAYDNPHFTDRVNERQSATNLLLLLLAVTAALLLAPAASANDVGLLRTFLAIDHAYQGWSAASTSSAPMETLIIYAQTLETKAQAAQAQLAGQRSSSAQGQTFKIYVALMLQRLVGMTQAAEDSYQQTMTFTGCGSSYCQQAEMPYVSASLQTFRSAVTGYLATRNLAIVAGRRIR